MTGLNLPSKPYDEVKSEFIKERISERQFELDSHREYIADLIYLEEWILGNINTGMSSGMKYKKIKSDHEEEYLKILEELDEEKYEKEIQKRENEMPSYKNVPTQRKEIQEAKGKWLEVKT